ncbi:hypothetical protein [Streptomyces sp. NPDC056492]|uniref:hypothetical protein n=1 Tax=unclassified Streptomyces TaxID=2593676 RepID=UPI0036CD87ED
MDSSSASHPAHYTVLLRPGLAEPGDSARRGVLRTALVEATGDFGASGYPRYAGEGVQADIDPETRTVEAVTVDGDELPYGWVAQLAEE